MVPSTHREPNPVLRTLLIGLAAITAAIPFSASPEVILPPRPTATLLQTDHSTALHSVRLPLGLPFGVGLIRIEFDLSFGTMEQPAPGEFLDSISLSIEPAGTDETAWLWIQDARGETWVPENQGGLSFPAGLLHHSAISFPADQAGAWPIHTSYAVALTLPFDCQNCEAGLWLDLFDNRTGPDSVALLRNLRLVARNPFFLLESSATPAGPFSNEMGVSHSATNQSFELMRGGVARFFRLRADSAVRLQVLERDPDFWRFAYVFPEPDPKLESATRPQGPYTPQTNAVLDPDRRQFRLRSENGSARFFRIRANVRTAITRLESTGGTNQITFEYRPRIFGLQSSAQPCGPFADDPAARFDTARQIITVSRTQLIRVFRITHSNPGDTVRLLGIHGDHARWVLPYDIRASSTATNASTPPREVQP